MTEGDRKEIKKLLKTTYNSGFDAGINATLKAIETTPQGTDILGYVKDFFQKPKTLSMKWSILTFLKGKMVLKLKKKRLTLQS